MKPYWLQNNIDISYTGSYTEATLRDIVLRNISLVSHSSLQAKKLFNTQNFLNFLRTQTDMFSKFPFTNKTNILIPKEEKDQKSEKVPEITPIENTGVLSS